MENGPIGVIKVHKFDFRGKNAFVGMLGRINGRRGEPLVVPLIEGLREIDSIRKERGADIKVVSPALADYLMMSDRIYWDSVPEQCRIFWREFVGCGFPTDLWVIYELEGKPFGKTIESNTRRGKQQLRFRVPQRFQGPGSENTAIIARGLRAEDVNLETMIVSIADEARLIQYHDFPPCAGGLYVTDPETIMPFGKMYEYFGKEMPEEPEKLRLRCPCRFEVSQGSFVGVQSRVEMVYKGSQGTAREHIVMLWSILDLTCVVVEIPEADLGKIAHMPLKLNPERYRAEI